MLVSKLETIGYLRGFSAAPSGADARGESRRIAANRGESRRID
jgi:hypothetical protein